MNTDKEPPAELVVAIEEFFALEERENALAIAQLESSWDAFALNDTTDAAHPCGSLLRWAPGGGITAERSVGYFQINVCNFPSWEWQRLYNARHNVGTAHMLFQQAGNRWTPWFYSAKRLGLLP